MALHFGQNSWKLINLLILCRRQHPILHPQDQVGGIRYLRVVGDHDDAAALLVGKAAQNVHDDPRVLPVQVPRGLVRQEDRGTSSRRWIWIPILCVFQNSVRCSALKQISNGIRPSRIVWRTKIVKAVVRLTATYCTLPLTVPAT